MYKFWVETLNIYKFIKLCSDGAFNFHNTHVVLWSMSHAFRKHLALLGETFCSLPENLCILWYRQFSPGSIRNYLIIFCHTGPLKVLISSVWFSRTPSWLGKCHQFLCQSRLSELRKEGNASSIPVSRGVLTPRLVFKSNIQVPYLIETS